VTDGSIERRVGVGESANILFLLLGAPVDEHGVEPRAQAQLREVAVRQLRDVHTAAAGARCHRPHAAVPPSASPSSSAVRKPSTAPVAIIKSFYAGI
jgi:hypothetical protein